MWLDHLLSREINGSKLRFAYKTIHPEVEIDETTKVLSLIIYLVAEIYSSSICFQSVLSSVFKPSGKKLKCTLKIA